MAKIGISLNEVLRNFISQLIRTYEKYSDDTTVIKEEDITSFNLLEFFKFDSENQLNTFLYKEETLEIFGHADQMYNGIINHFNNFLMDINDDGEHEIELVSREIDKAIPSTMFFLSKTGCRAEKIRFVKSYQDKWKDIDILITANPKALESKPSGKISVKVNAPYNKNVAADYTVDSLLDIIKDEALRNKIFNTKITSYEEIN